MLISHDLVEAALAVAESRGDGILFHSHLIEAGLPPSAIRRLLLGGRLVHLRRGAYARPDAVTTGRDRHRLVVRASMALGGERVASHWAASALHGLPLIGTWPSTLHTTDPATRGGSSSSGVTTHRGVLDVDSVVRIDGVRATSLARTVIDMARVLPFASAVAIVDESMKRGLSNEALLAELEAASPRYGYARAAGAVAFGDSRAANPGESLSRARIHELGYATPDLQVPFVDTRGDDREVDFFWPAIRKIGEFDGIHKYTRAEYTGGAPTAEIVVREKRREDALRPLVDSFDRWIWDDAISPKKFDRFLREHGMPRA